MVWHIGNTTVRTPYRLVKALQELVNSSLDGNLDGPDQEYAFAKLLHNSGVLQSDLVAKGIKNQNSCSLGRKWRSVLSQLGFLTPKLTEKEIKELGPEAPAELATPYKVTESGRRLAGQELLTAQQESFLRSLLAYRIPSILETRYSSQPFSPLRFVLHIIKLLGRNADQGYLTFQEFSFFVQTSTPEDGIGAIVSRIEEYRNGRLTAAGNVKAFDKLAFAEAVKKEHGELSDEDINKKKGTFKDYTDLSFRYLKATGLFAAKGRGICLAKPKESLATAIAEERDLAVGHISYLHTLWKGAPLPTDDEAKALAVVDSLKKTIQDRGIEITEEIPKSASIADINHHRHFLEDVLNKEDEMDYYRKQVTEIDDIICWLQALAAGKNITCNGKKYIIPKGEAPAYFEWAVWRAFLAINSLANKPWDARNFQIDQDFLPVHTAPGGGPDIVFEFDDKVIVTEVTLTRSSRQEAAEGEPVRRHVAQEMQKHVETNKTVYGLFLAVNIDTNTAHTFLSGNWYLPDDTRINVDIIPITLDDFIKVLSAGKEYLDTMPNEFEGIFNRCREEANLDAPEWKVKISDIIEESANSFS